jgi:hypothetical protein
MLKCLRTWMTLSRRIRLEQSEPLTVFEKKIKTELNWAKTRSAIVAPSVLPRARPVLQRAKYR